MLHNPIRISHNNLPKTHTFSAAHCNALSCNSRSPTSPTSWNDDEADSPINSTQMSSKLLASGSAGGSFLDGPGPANSSETGQLQHQQQQAQQQQQQQHLFGKASSSFDMQSVSGHAQQHTPQSQSHMHHHHHPSGLLVTALDGPDAMAGDGDTLSKAAHGTELNEHDNLAGGPGGNGGGETETKSISSFKSMGSITDRYRIRTTSSSTMTHSEGMECEAHRPRP